MYIYIYTAVIKLYKGIRVYQQHSRNPVSTKKGKKERELSCGRMTIGGGGQGMYVSFVDKTPLRGLVRSIRKYTRKERAGRGPHKISSVSRSTSPYIETPHPQPRLDRGARESSKSPCVWVGHISPNSRSRSRSRSGSPPLPQFLYVTARRAGGWMRLRYPPTLASKGMERGPDHSARVTARRCEAPRDDGERDGKGREVLIQKSNGMEGMREKRG